MSDDFRAIPLTKLIDPPVVLRPVDRTTMEYLELRDSIAKYGVLNGICVRPSKKTPGMFEVVDGRYRVAASRDAQKTEIHCVIRDLTNYEVLAIQIVTNAQRLQTAPSDFARQIRKILHEKEGMSQAELCQLLHKNPYWIRKMLGLAKLARYKVYRRAADLGEMSLEAAYWLSRLPYTMWGQYLPDAKTLSLKEFRALVQTVLRQYRTAKLDGRLERFYAGEVDAQPRLRGLRELLPELERPQSGPMWLASLNCVTPLDGWLCALRWVVHLDSDSVEKFRTRIRQRMRGQVLKQHRDRKKQE